MNNKFFAATFLLIIILISSNGFAQNPTTLTVINNCTAPLQSFRVWLDEVPGGVGCHGHMTHSHVIDAGDQYTWDNLNSNCLEYTIWGFSNIAKAYTGATVTFATRNELCICVQGCRD